ncbi:MAG: LL-diaminopimelate aminotransferase [Chlamydiota bacterium]
MAKGNCEFQKLQSGYLFPEIQKRASLFRKANLDIPLIDLGIGDATRPIAPTILQAMIQATEEMGKVETFRGYGPSEGYPFLQEAICQHDYTKLPISSDEIFISDGTKNDIANFQEIFASSCKVALQDPTYPVYIDSSVMGGRAGSILENGSYEKILYLPCTKENQFCPPLPTEHADIIYLCSPNNPTGEALSKTELEKWVAYALREKAIILFDGAYEAFITDKDIPHSIYEIPGADTVAVEFRSFSKTAGFTGLRGSYVVVPKKLFLDDGLSVHAMWKRRVQTKYGGTSYPIQRGMEAIYSPQGQKETKAILHDYLQSAFRLKEKLTSLGLEVFGGTNAPYIWVQAPSEKTSWEFFDHLLHKCHIISIPGKGFGPSGEGYVRFSALAKKDVIDNALIAFHSM